MMGGSYYDNAFGYTDRRIWSESGAPTVNDDETVDAFGFTFEVGSLWLDTSTHILWECRDATSGAAVWAVLSYPPENQGSRFGPGDSGFVTWNFDESYAFANLTLTSGRAELQRVRLGRPATITGAAVSVGTAGLTLTSGQNLVALYDTSGNRLALSTDQTTNWGSGPGTKQAAFTATYAASTGDYFVGILSVGSTAVSLRRGDSTTGPNGVLPATPLSAYRALRSSATNLTSLASTIDIAANYIATGNPIWVGLY